MTPRTLGDAPTIVCHQSRAMKAVALGIEWKSIIHSLAIRNIQPQCPPCNMLTPPPPPHERPTRVRLGALMKIPGIDRGGFLSRGPD